jgi:hypothetical protein
MARFSVQHAIWRQVSGHYRKTARQCLMLLAHVFALRYLTSNGAGLRKSERTLTV